MLNSFWFEQKRITDEKYFFIDDTTDTFPDMYRFVYGNVQSTESGIRFTPDAYISTTQDIRVSVSNCTIEYTINCSSLSNISIHVSELEIYPTYNGQIQVDDKLFCQVDSFKPNIDNRIKYVSDGSNYYVFLNDIQIGGPESFTKTYSPFSNVYIAADDVYIKNFTISNVFSINGYVSNTFTKRLITPYDTNDGAVYDPNGFRIGYPSTIQQTSWTGWMNLSSYSNITMASPDGYMVFVAGGVTPQIIGRTGDSALPVTFSFSRASANTYVPVTVYANALSGYTLLFDDIIPVTLGKFQSVQFPKRFKILPTFRINDVDVLMEITDDSKLREVYSGLYVSSNPLRLDSMGAKWTFTRDTISSDDGFLLTGGYTFQ